MRRNLRPEEVGDSRRRGAGDEFVKEAGVGDAHGVFVELRKEQGLPMEGRSRVWRAAQ